MQKNFPIKRKNTKSVLGKSKSLMDIANKILSEPSSFPSKSNQELVDESWMQKLWEWADENNIPNLTWIENPYNTKKGYWTGLPRDEKELLNLSVFKYEMANATRLPQELCSLTKLEKLCLRANNIVEIPKEIGQLKNLTILNLAMNSLTGIPKEISKLSHLDKLDLSHNKIKRLPKEISNLTRLKELNLKYNFELVLTQEQKEWITMLQKNNCKVDI